MDDARGTLTEIVAKAIYSQWPNTYTVRRALTTTEPQYERVSVAETWDEMCENTPSRKIECIDAARVVLAAIEASGARIAMSASQYEKS